MKFGFVILHYKTFDMTVQCIESVIRLNRFEEVTAVVVDNASNDGSAQQLREQYQDYENIIVYETGANLGFSAGNNLGVACLHEQGQFEFIVVANNDTVFEQIDFLEKLEKLYESEQFFVAGPDIYEPRSKVHQNPHRTGPLSKKELHKKLQSHKWNLKHINYVVAKRYLLSFIFKDSYRSIREKKDLLFAGARQYSKPAADVCLQGACLIFSKLFFERREKIFCPETFFYYEEDILTKYCEDNGLKTCYLPELQVLHYEGISTAKSFHRAKDKELFKIQNPINSVEICLSLYD